MGLGSRVQRVGCISQQESRSQMTVELKGNSATCLTAGILLMTRARSFGQRLDVAIVGAPTKLRLSEGLRWSIVQCWPLVGLADVSAAGAQVVVPENATDPLAISVAEGGDGGWFYIDRSGGGRHPVPSGLVHLFQNAHSELGAAGQRSVPRAGGIGLCA